MSHGGNSSFQEWNEVTSIHDGDELFGHCITSNGNFIAVSEIYNDNLHSGFVQSYIFNSSNEWEQNCFISTPYGYDYREYSFGYSSTIPKNHSSNYIIIGAPAIHGINKSGFIEIFAWEPGVSCNFKTGIVIEGFAPDEGFGKSVDTDDSGNIIVVGAPNKNNNKGGAYILYGINWQNHFLLTGSNTPNSFYGAAVAISGDGNTVAIGAPADKNNYGKVYVYRYQNNAWSLINILSSNQKGDLMGTSLELNYDGTILIVGSPGYKPTGLHFDVNESYGRVSTYKINSNGSVSTYVPDIIGEKHSSFGYRLSLDDNILIVSAPAYDYEPLDVFHKTYVKVFKLQSGISSHPYFVNWIQIGNKIIPPSILNNYCNDVSISKFIRNNEEKLLVNVSFLTFNSSPGFVKTYELKDLIKSKSDNESTSFVIFPNPSKDGIFSIKWNQKPFSGLIIVQDFSNKILYKTEIIQPLEEYSFKTYLDPGTYILTLINKNNKSTKTLITINK